MSGGIPQETGEKIADFATYPAAQKAVSQLIEADIPARDIAIVGHGLRSVETITGRLGYAAAARSGAINGILLGLLFSAIFVLGTTGAGIQLFVGVMFVGIALGMLMSLIAYAIVRRRRDYTSVTQVLADRYEVTVLPRSIHRAREVVGRTKTPAPLAFTPATPRTDPEAPASPAAPPQYGERIELPPPQYGERIDAPPPAEQDRPAPPPQ
ncbi:general stress protein [Microbacterium sp.]|uniref:general stress protein n=1 Tax=Microbacterium sp. TaxID=51671 RepID=UPI0039E35C04